jgi:hypothetical protein
MSAILLDAPHRDRPPRARRRALTPARGIPLTDALVGVNPTWRPEPTPIYDELIAELGSPFGDVPPTAGAVMLVGEVVQ